MLYLLQFVSERVFIKKQKYEFLFFDKVYKSKSPYQKNDMGWIKEILLYLGEASFFRTEMILLGTSAEISYAKGDIVKCFKEKNQLLKLGDLFSLLF